MRIVRLTAANLKRLVAVEIVPDPDRGLVLVTGKNGAGKTSVLDAIWFALGGGGALHATPRPIREGQEQAEVTLDLGELTVTRIWRTGKPMQLKVLAADGAKYGSPQKVLDGLVGQMSFDPLAFTQLDSRAQRQMLEGLVRLPFDPAEIARARQAAYDQRTEAGREGIRLKGVLESMSPAGEGLPIVPETEVSIADLLDTRQQLVDQHDTYVYASTRLSDLKGFQGQAQAEVERLSQALQEARDHRDRTDRKVADQERRLQELDDVDTEAVDRMIRDAEKINAAVRANRERAAIAAQHKAARERYEALSEEIRELDEEQRLGLEEATFPVEGLSFDAEGVTYHGVPFRQCSSGEQLRISIGMAMALNPEIRVIRITDGSLLDSANLKLIGEMAAERDFQIWVEVVDESGEIGVVIEDGLVVS